MGMKSRFTKNRSPDVLYDVDCAVDTDNGGDASNEHRERQPGQGGPEEAGQREPETPALLSVLVLQTAGPERHGPRGDHLDERSDPEDGHAFVHMGRRASERGTRSSSPLGTAAYPACRASLHVH